MTHNSSFITPLTIVTVLISVVISGVFLGGTGNENQIHAVENQLTLYPNIETAGVVLNGIALPKSAQLMYYQNGETDWRAGHPLFRIDDGRLVGSLFGLSPVTSYEIKIINKSTEISGSFTTQGDELSYTPSTILHVKANAPAG